MEIRTVDTMLAGMIDMVNRRDAISPTRWAEFAVYLTVLQGEENAKLIELEFEYNKVKAKQAMEILPDGKRISNALATDLTQSTEEWYTYNKHRAHCEHIQNCITSSKKYATIAGDEFRNAGML